MKKAKTQLNILMPTEVLNTTKKIIKTMKSKGVLTAEGNSISVSTVVKEAIVDFNEQNKDIL